MRAGKIRGMEGGTEEQLFDLPRGMKEIASSTQGSTGYVASHHKTLMVPGEYWEFQMQGCKKPWIGLVDQLYRAEEGDDHAFVYWIYDAQDLKEVWRGLSFMQCGHTKAPVKDEWLLSCGVQKVPVKRAKRRRVPFVILAPLRPNVSGVGIAKNTACDDFGYLNKVSLTTSNSSSRATVWRCYDSVDGSVWPILAYDATPERGTRFSGLLDDLVNKLHHEDGPGLFRDTVAIAVVQDDPVVQVRKKRRHARPELQLQVVIAGTPVSEESKSWKSLWPDTGQHRGVCVFLGKCYSCWEKKCSQCACSSKAQ